MISETIAKSTSLHTLPSQTLLLRNPIDTSAAAIKVDFKKGDINLMAFVEALMASGFQVLVKNRTEVQLNLFPCPVGTFSNSSSRGIFGCTPCPPGI